MSTNRGKNLFGAYDNKGKNSINNNFINDYVKDTNHIIEFRENKKFHSRFIIIDYPNPDWILYLCGGSSKDSGNKINPIIKIDEKDLYIKSINEVLNNKLLVI